MVIRTHRLAIPRQFSYECTEINQLLIEKALLKHQFAHQTQIPILRLLIDLLLWMRHISNYSRKLKPK